MSASGLVLAPATPAVGPRGPARGAQAPGWREGAAGAAGGPPPRRPPRPRGAGAGQALAACAATAAARRLDWQLRGAARRARACRAAGAVPRRAEAKAEEPEKSIEERFADFTRVLPWFDFAATVLDQHAERRARVRKDADLDAAQAGLARGEGDLSRAVLDAAGGREGGSAALEGVVEAALRAAEAGHAAAPLDLEGARGRWEVLWSGALSPLQRVGFPRQCIWVEVAGDRGAPVLTAYSGLPLGLFGAYVWTSAAGELVPGDALPEGGRRPALIRFNRYWIDVGPTPRSDIGRVDGGFITGRIAAFGAALLTPVLLEFGALKWLLERFGLERVFEVEVPSPDGEGGTVKLQASLELYLTLLAMVSFPESLSTCPVPYLDAERGVCVFEIPMLGPVGDLPRWLHPGGNSAALVARRLPDGAEPGLLLQV